MNYRIVWTNVPKAVVSVIEDISGTITNYNEVNHSHAVVEDLEEFRGGLVIGGYDVSVIDQYIIDNAE